MSTRKQVTQYYVDDSIASDEATQDPCELKECTNSDFEQTEDCWAFGFIPY